METAWGGRGAEPHSPLRGSDGPPSPACQCPWKGKPSPVRSRGAVVPPPGGRSWMRNRSETQGLGRGQEMQERRGHGGQVPLPAAKPRSESQCRPHPEHGFLCGVGVFSRILPHLLQPQGKGEAAAYLGRLPEARCCQERSSQPTGTSGIGNLMSRCCPWLFVAICARCHPRGMPIVLKNPLHGQSQWLLSCHCLSTDCLHHDRGPGHSQWLSSSRRFPVPLPSFSHPCRETEESRGCGRRQSIPPDPCASPAHRAAGQKGIQISEEGGPCSRGSMLSACFGVKP